MGGAWLRGVVEYNCRQDGGQTPSDPGTHYSSAQLIWRPQTMKLSVVLLFALFAVGAVLAEFGVSLSLGRHLASKTSFLLLPIFSGMLSAKNSIM